jgi:hypothetical protein
MQRSSTETFFLYGLMGLTLLLSTGFVIATVGWGYGFPAVFVSLILAAFIAILAYTSLGGVGGDVFQLGPAKLTGAIAGLVAVFWLVNGPMANDMKDVKAIAAGKDAQKQIDAAEAKALDEQRLRHKAEQRVAELQAASSDEQSNSVSAILQKIQASSADEPLGKGVLQLMKDGKGPFRATLQTLTLKARFNEKVPQATFLYCHDKRPELQDHPVQFEIVDPDTGSSQKIVLNSGADIGPGICAQIKFDVQIGCDAVKALLGGSTSACDVKRGIAWTEPSANKVYDLTATILNPDLVH